MLNILDVKCFVELVTFDEYLICLLIYLRRNTLHEHTELPQAEKAVLRWEAHRSSRSISWTFSTDHPSRTVALEWPAGKRSRLAIERSRSLSVSDWRFPLDNPSRPMAHRNRFSLPSPLGFQPNILTVSRWTMTDLPCHLSGGSRWITRHDLGHTEGQFGEI